MEIIFKIVDLNINVLLFMEECIAIGDWWMIREYFDIDFSIQDMIFTIWGMARKYLDMGLDNYYIAIMVTLKEIFLRIGPG